MQLRQQYLTNLLAIKCVSRLPGQMFSCCLFDAFEGSDVSTVAAASVS